MPVRDAQQVAEGLAQRRHPLLDVRAEERFLGRVEPIDPVAGHVPGAVNVPFAGNLTADSRFQPGEALARRYAPVRRGPAARRDRLHVRLRRDGLPRHLRAGTCRDAGRCPVPGLLERVDPVAGPAGGHGMIALPARIACQCVAVRLPARGLRTGRLRGSRRRGADRKARQCRPRPSPGPRPASTRGTCRTSGCSTGAISSCTRPTTQMPTTSASARRPRNCALPSHRLPAGRGPHLRVRGRAADRRPAHLGRAPGNHRRLPAFAREPADAPGRRRSRAGPGRTAATAGPGADVEGAAAAPAPENADSGGEK